MDFQVFHKYNRLVRRGACKPLTCRHCGNELTLRVGTDDEPELMCFFCNVLTKPGLKMYSDIRSVVKEHFE